MGSNLQKIRENPSNSYKLLLPFRLRTQHFGVRPTMICDSARTRNRWVLWLVPWRFQVSKSFITLYWLALKCREYQHSIVLPMGVVWKN